MNLCSIVQIYKYSIYVVLQILPSNALPPLFVVIFDIFVLTEALRYSVWYIATTFFSASCWTSSELIKCTIVNVTAELPKEKLQ